MPRHFIKLKENFICDHCGTKVIGSGYTNHCPNCLYSKHVDNLVPGDRQSKCLGVMEPIGLQIKAAKPIIFHQCLKCHKLTRTKAAANDNPKKLLLLSQFPTPY